MMQMLQKHMIYNNISEVPLAGKMVFVKPVPSFHSDAFVLDSLSPSVVKTYLSYFSDNIIHK